MASIYIDANFNAISLHKNYRLTQQDRDQQPGILLSDLHCSDPEIEFIGFAPNAIDLEQDDTNAVTQAENNKGLNTISLTLGTATRENYLNYMICPKLKGIFTMATVLQILLRPMTE